MKISNLRGTKDIFAEDINLCNLTYLGYSLDNPFIHLSRYIFNYNNIVFSNFYTTLPFSGH